jgi:hypothetical protein
VGCEAGEGEGCAGDAGNWLKVSVCFSLLLSFGGRLQ